MGVKLRFRRNCSGKRSFLSTWSGNHLQFHCDLASGRPRTATIGDGASPDGSLALSGNVVGDGDTFSDEARQVARARRKLLPSRATHGTSSHHATASGRLLGSPV